MDLGSRTTACRVLAGATAEEMVHRLLLRMPALGDPSAIPAAAVLIDQTSCLACTLPSGQGDLRAGRTYCLRPRGSAEAIAALVATHRRYTALLRQRPGAAELWAGRSSANLLLERPHIAATDAMVSQDLAPFEPWPYMLVAEACLAMGAAAEARVHCLEGLKSDPDHKRLHRLLASIESLAAVTADQDTEPEPMYPVHASGAQVLWLGDWVCTPRQCCVTDRSDSATVIQADSVGQSVARAHNRGRLALQEIPGAGSGLVALADFQPAEVLFIDVPHISVSFDPTRCQQCMRPVQKRRQAGEQESWADEEVGATDRGLSAVPAVTCPDCGESYCCKDCRSIAWAAYHSVQCGKASTQIQRCQASLWELGKPIDQHYHVTMAVRQLAISITRALQNQEQQATEQELHGDKDVREKETAADCVGSVTADTPILLDNMTGLSHLVGMGDDATPEIARAHPQDFSTLLRQYELFRSLSGLKDAADAMVAAPAAVSGDGNAAATYLRPTRTRDEATQEATVGTTPLYGDRDSPGRLPWSSLAPEPAVSPRKLPQEREEARRSLLSDAMRAAVLAFDFEWYSRFFGICVVNCMADDVGSSSRDATDASLIAKSREGLPRSNGQQPTPHQMVASHVSLCRMGSLCNHSCAPNAGATSPSSLTSAERQQLEQQLELEGERDTGNNGRQCRMPANAMVFRARERGIQKGEQVLVSYIDTTELSMGLARRRACLAHYLFECACARCCAEDLASA